MHTTRRAFLSASAAAAASVVVRSDGVAERSSSLPAARQVRDVSGEFDPWLEVDPAALRNNVRAIGALAGGRPVIAVVKNNAYGLSLRAAAEALEGAPEVMAFAVVKTDEAMALREAGVRKPVLLMGAVGVADAVELVRRDVRITPFTDGSDQFIVEVARRAGRPVALHLYIDTGMSRLGMPYHRAMPWIETLARRTEARIEGVFTTFTEDEAFDAEQLARFTELLAAVKAKGVPTGRAHAASSHALFFRTGTQFDAVRPGLGLFGAYPAGADRSKASLTPAFRLCARVARVEQLRTGDSVSYGRNYIAVKPTWIATLPVGHADGYPRRAVNGCEVLIGGRTYRVIGAVSASHTIVELGDERAVETGTEATLVGPDHPSIHPNTVAERTGASVYDVLMHLSARLPVRAPRA